MPSCRRCGRRTFCEEFCMEKLCSYRVDAKRVSQLPAMTVKPPKLSPEKIKILPPTCVSDYTYMHDVIGITLVEKAFPQYNRVHSSRGYDFITDDKKKIRLLCAVSRIHKHRQFYWSFTIGQNKFPDYFLCIAFDEPINAVPQGAWLIPSHLVNSKETISFRNPEKNKWTKYEFEIPLIAKCWRSLKFWQEVPPYAGIYGKPPNWRYKKEYEQYLQPPELTDEEWLEKNCPGLLSYDESQGSNGALASSQI